MANILFLIAIMIIVFLSWQFNPSASVIGGIIGIIVVFVMQWRRNRTGSQASRGGGMMPPAPIAPPQARPSGNQQPPRSEAIPRQQESAKSVEEQISGEITHPDFQTLDLDDDEFSVDIDDILVIPAPSPIKPITPQTIPSEQEEVSEEVSEEAPAIKPVFFTAYYPRETPAKVRSGLYVYAHLESALDHIQADVKQFTESMGGTVPRPAVGNNTYQLADGALVTVMPEADGIEFDPVAVTKKWRAPYTRFDFGFTAPESLVGEIITGRIAILVNMIEVSSIKFAVMVEAPSTSAQPMLDVTTNNPLAMAKFTSSPATHIYNKIFVSYSRADKQVAENYRLAQLAAGHDVFMDTYSIRTGEDWRAALANAIDSADIFQLFWSEHSAGSENVRDEWDYALQFRCNEDKCANFIRPVFWDKPMPTPPSELGHLNFRFVPLIVDEDHDQ